MLLYFVLFVCNHLLDRFVCFELGVACGFHTAKLAIAHSINRHPREVAFNIMRKRNLTQVQALLLLVYV